MKKEDIEKWLNNNYSESGGECLRLIEEAGGKNACSSVSIIEACVSIKATKDIYSIKEDIKLYMRTI